METFFSIQTLSNQKVLIAITAIFLILIIITIFSVIRLFIIERRMKSLFKSSGTKDLEHLIKSTFEDIKDLKEFTEEMRQYLTTVETRLRSSVQAVETVRFNPFAGTGSGGNNSFSTAFVDQNGKGLTLTSLYARDRVSIFAKPLEDFSSSFELSDEEKEAINAAKRSMK